MKNELTENDEQFKQLVLKQNTMEKEIIGYKLKANCENYRKVSLILCKTVVNWENSSVIYDIGVSQSCYIDKLKAAGVLDLWFEPVYRSKEVEFDYKKAFKVALSLVGNFSYKELQDFISNSK